MKRNYLLSLPFQGLAFPVWTVVFATFTKMWQSKSCQNVSPKSTTYASKDTHGDFLHLIHNRKSDDRVSFVLVIGGWVMTGQPSN
jgi:hypothetical protein